MYADTIDYLANLAASRVALLKKRNQVGFSTKLKVEGQPIFVGC